MSEIDARLNTDPTENLQNSILTSSGSGFFGRSKDWLLECCSSILVKEGRQALKSFQFMGTYSVLIVTVIAWTMLAFVTAYNGQRSYGFSSTLLCGYFVILGLPLGVIVPFSAFRSLSREYEDGTIQLISITTMKPYQIVVGKLATAMLQMVIYLAVVAPCIAFTNLLDGVSFAQIFVGLSFAIFGCFVLTIFGLLLAGASRSYAFGLAISTAFVLGLGALFIGWWNFVMYGLYDSASLNTAYRSSEFWAVYFIVVSFALSTAIVMLAAAASQISFATDNRSSLVRYALLGQLVFYFATLVMLAGAFATVTGAFGPFHFFVLFSCHYWLIIGCMLSGESGEMSRRVLRGLPTSLLGRTFGSLLMPGPGRGYLFALAGMFSCNMVALIIAVFARSFMDPSSDLFDFNRFSMGIQPPDVDYLIRSMLAYMIHPVGILTLVYLLMECYRMVTGRRIPGSAGPVAGLFVGLFIMFMSCSIGVAAISWDDNYGSDYNLGIFEAANWYLVINRIGDVSYSSTNNTFTIGWQYLALIPYGFGALLLLFIAFAIASKEFAVEKIAVPQRVLKDVAASKEIPEDGETIDEIFGDLDQDAPKKEKM